MAEPAQESLVRRMRIAANLLMDITRELHPEENMPYAAWSPYTLRKAADDLERSSKCAASVSIPTGGVYICSQDAGHTDAHMSAGITWTGGKT